MAETTDWQCDNCSYVVELSGTAVNQVGKLQDVVRQENGGDLCCDNPDFSPA